MLTTRALNRATLHRQWLVERADASAAAAVEHLVGMQAQEPFSAYYGLWSRLNGFKAAELADLLTGRGAVRVPLYRATIHLLTAADHARVQPLFREMLRKRFLSSPYGGGAKGVDLDELEAAALPLLTERPRTRRELCTLLAERWPERDAESLGSAIAQITPVVQVPPRGVWGQSGPAAWAPAAQWLGERTETGDAADLIRRYLAAFGPATVKDVQTWCGLTRLRQVTADMDLRVLADESGRDLLDLPDGPLPDEDTPVPVRFLPEFDNLLLAHHDRTRVISQEDYRRGVVIGGKPTLLVDGFVHGVWRVKDGALDIEAFRPLTRAQRADVLAEGARLLDFAEFDGPVRISAT
jgi:hypothetical protein